MIDTALGRVTNLRGRNPYFKIPYESQLCGMLVGRRCCEDVKGSRYLQGYLMSGTSDKPIVVSSLYIIPLTPTLLLVFVKQAFQHLWSLPLLAVFEPVTRS